MQKKFKGPEMPSVSSGCKYPFPMPRGLVNWKILKKMKNLKIPQATLEKINSKGSYNKISHQTRIKNLNKMVSHYVQKEVQDEHQRRRQKRRHGPSMVQ